MIGAGYKSGCSDVACGCDGNTNGSINHLGLSFAGNGKVNSNAEHKGDEKTWASMFKFYFFLLFIFKIIREFISENISMARLVMSASVQLLTIGSKRNSTPSW